MCMYLVACLVLLLSAANRIILPLFLGLNFGQHLRMVVGK